MAETQLVNVTSGPDQGALSAEPSAPTKATSEEDVIASIHKHMDVATKFLELSISPSLNDTFPDDKGNNSSLFIDTNSPQPIRNTYGTAADRRSVAFPSTVVFEPPPLTSESPSTQPEDIRVALPEVSARSCHHLVNFKALILLIYSKWTKTLRRPLHENRLVKPDCHIQQITQL
jgi:hypothetical protein